MTNRIVSVCFNVLSVSPQRGHKHYDYILPEGMDAQLGDIAVVNSPFDGIVPTLIVGMAKASRKATKKVEAVISMAPLREARWKQEREIAVRKVLDEKLAQRVRDNRYEVIMDDAEARELMREIGLV
jgi:hypothetical protein